ncbi:MAG: hypothetical protein ACRC4W_05305 [Treponemataceae bacterium]
MEKFQKLFDVLAEELRKNTGTTTVKHGKVCLVSTIVLDDVNGGIDFLLSLEQEIKESLEWTIAGIKVLHIDAKRISVVIDSAKGENGEKIAVYVWYKEFDMFA